MLQQEWMINCTRMEKRNYYIFFVISTFMFLTKHATSSCDGETGSTCCDGYMWDDKKNECRKCSIGYFGESCRMKCPFPSYGDTCQGICNCKELECDFKLGCNKFTSSGNTTPDASSAIIHKTSTYNSRNFSATIKTIGTEKDNLQFKTDNTLIYVSTTSQDISQKEDDELWQNPLLIIIVAINVVFLLMITFYAASRILRKRSSDQAHLNFNNSKHGNKGSKDDEYEEINEAMFSTILQNQSAQYKEIAGPTLQESKPLNEIAGPTLRKPNLPSDTKKNKQSVYSEVHKISRKSCKHNTEKDQDNASDLKSDVEISPSKEAMYLTVV